MLHSTPYDCARLTNNVVVRWMGYCVRGVFNLSRLVSHLIVFFQEIVCIFHQTLYNWLHPVYIFGKIKVR